MRTAPTTTRRLLPVALAAPAFTPATALAVPAVVPGCPVPAPAGPVLPGAGGGALTVGLTLHQAVNMPAVAAFDASGKRRWVSTRLPACGNCDGGQPAGANPDGSFGPIAAQGALELPDGTVVASQGSAGVPSPSGPRQRSRRARRTSASSPARRDGGALRRPVVIPTPERCAATADRGTFPRMIEAVVILGVAAGAVVRVRVARRGELRRARQRAEGVLDELAADTCAALAKGRESRRSDRAIRRYERARDSVALAGSRRELDRLVSRHHRRRRATELASRGLGRARGIVGGGIPRRR